MSTSIAVAEQNTQMAPPHQPSAMELLQLAVDKGASIDTIERLAKLQKEMQEDAARVSFDNAIHKAQSEMRRVVMDAANPQTRSKYATYAALDASLRPIYTQNGFAVSFNTEPASEPLMVRVVAHVSHVGGHTRRYQTEVAADGKGAKGNDVMTRTHAIGSAISYGKRYLTLMIWNVVVAETDDDGNAAGGAMAEGDLLNAIDSIREASTDEELKSRYMAAMRAAQGAGDRNAERTFAHEKNARYRQLHPQGGAR